MSFKKQYFGKSDHKFASVNEPHTYKGSIIRHVAVENAIILIAKPTSLRLIRNEKFYRIIRVYTVILWGLNCNFPFKDIALYVVDHLKETFKGKLN